MRASRAAIQAQRLRAFAGVAFQASFAARDARVFATFAADLFKLERVPMSPTIGGHIRPAAEGRDHTGRGYARNEFNKKSCCHKNSTAYGHVKK